MHEKLKHMEAFEYYYSLGDNRTLKKVFQKYTYSIPAVKKWSVAFNWQERIELRDINNGKKLEIKTDKIIVNSKADYRALIRQTVDLYKQKLNEGRIQISRPQDLETLVKLDLTLMGEASEITDNKSLYELVEEFRKIIDPKDIKKCIKQISESK